MSNPGVPESSDATGIRSDQIKIDPDQIDANGGDDDTLSDNSQQGGNDKALEVQVTVL